jgi:hypothetical protein
MRAEAQLLFPAIFGQATQVALHHFQIDDYGWSVDF